ncbi:Fic family protein [Candidatus Dojkabacteria bacterium]|uniref:Fic family protein n=1 Tax=Candidatus Dojkabacteria bacterium TaxID=2099670 RepID=A0A955KWJ3_9BACT|nr:Fic family protein [Candidatus Dojkabacteria bacterium]MCB9790547.1 Fic family protein [Candidatus Nomurabacteria bacterium]
MKTPTFTITNLISDYLIRYEVSLERIKSTPLPHTHREELEGDLLTDDIYNLSELIGDRIALHQAEQVQEGKVMPSARKRLIIFTNYRSAMEFVKSYNQNQFIPPSSELLSHINKLIINKVIEEWEAGKMRTFSDKPNEIYDTWYKYRDFYPDKNMSAYFDEFFRWMQDRSNKTHKLIQLAVLLFELIDKAPLYGGNQITSIATVAAIAKDAGYNPEGMLSYSKAINFIAEDLMSAFKMSRSKRDQTIFIEAFLYAVSLEMLNLEHKYTDTFQNKIKKQGKLKEKFNTRQIKILEYLENVGKITRQEYTKMMRVSFMTSYRDLQELIKEGFIKSGGVGRGTYYSLKRSAKNAEDKAEQRLEVFGTES